MAAEQRKDQRKQPHQQRSQATVERIVSAAGRVLAGHGYAGCSTNRIAAEADVSKGSVYQYFADKDEILTALAQRIADEMVEEIGSAIDGRLGGGIWAMGDAVLETTFDVVESRRSVLGPLLLEAPHIDVVGMASPVVRRANDIGRQYFAMNPAEHRDGLDVDAAMFVATSMLRSVLVDYVTGATDLSRERLRGALASAVAGLF